MDSRLSMLARSLNTIRNRMDEYISDKGVDTTGANTIYDLANKICEIPNEISHIHNGNAIFEQDQTLVKFPTLMQTRAFTSAYRMCYNCTALEEVESFDARNVTTFMYAFYGCTNLKRIGFIDTTCATTVSEMFHGCKSLVSIDSPLDFSRVSSNMDTTFTTCSALQEMRFTGTIKADLWVNGCSALSVDSLLSILNALVDFSATGGTHKLTLGARNKAKLSTAQLQIALDKGWTLP